jgi:hypothetical protein
VAAHLQHVRPGEQAAQDREHRHPLRHLKGLHLRFGWHARADRLLHAGDRTAEEGQLRERPARPGLAGRIGHRGPGHQRQGQIVHAQLLRLGAGIEHEVPAQQRGARVGAEQHGQFLVRGDFGVPGGEPVVRPADGVILGERGARVGRGALEGLPCVGRVALHGPAPDLRAGAHHRAAAAARLDQPLVPEQ